MAKYRIRVEALNANEKLPGEMILDTECEGYFMVAEKDGKALTNIQNQNVIMIAMGIAQDDDLMKAALIAKAIKEGVRLTGDD